jgi:hypothetical protein
MPVHRPFWSWQAQAFGEDEDQINNFQIVGVDATRNDPKCGDMASGDRYA